MRQRELGDLGHFILARGEMAEQAREAVGVGRALLQGLLLPSELRIAIPA